MPKLKSFVILSLSICVLSSNIAYADTCDDIRQLYGLSPKDTNEYHDFIEYVDLLGELNKKQENSVELIKAQDKYDELYQKYENLNSEKSNYITKISTLMKSSNNVLEIIGEVKGLKSVNTSLSSLNLNQEDFTYELNTDKYDSLNAKIGNDRAYINDRYDIGEVGKLWPVAVSSNKKVLKAFGSPGSENGVYLNASDANRVISLFTGIVTKVEHSETYGDWVEIQSGKGISVSYSFLDNIKVKVGQKVNIGDIISSIDNKELYVEMILDGKYVNPMLIMGRDGIEANNKWIYENPGVLDSTYMLNIDSYKYIPVSTIWDTSEDTNINDNNIIVVK